MKSTRPLLLLLLLAPALAFGKSKGRSSRVSDSVNEIVHKYSVDESTSNIAMKKATMCMPLGKFTVEFLLTKIKLVFFYGESISDRIEVSLNDAPNLVNNLRWNKNLPMAVYTFGWLNTPTNVYSREIVKAYHRNGGYNLVLVGWQDSGSWMQYGVAVTMVPHVGRAVAKTLEKLPPTVTIGHLVGHSLGAQITGHIARNLPQRPRFIIGLDPAGPLFYKTMFGCQDPISSSDADNVTVLHTDWSGLGSNEMTGSVDFMPHNGRSLQPGCNNLDVDTSPVLHHTAACSHNRAVMLFANAISNSSLVVGTMCQSYDAFRNKLCQNNPKAYLTVPSEHKGVFYFTTGDSEPYGQGDQGV